MRQTLVNLLLSNSSLKVISAILGFFYWSLLSDLYYINARYTVPIEIKTQKIIINRAPHKASITLRGLRKNVRMIDPSQLIVRIDDSELMQGNNLITLRSKHLHLPATVSLENYYPANFIINAHVLERQEPIVQV